MRVFLRNLYNIILSVILIPVLKTEKFSTEINERPIEYGFALRHIHDLCNGKLLDIASGKSSWPHLLSVCGYDVTAVDKKQGYWKGFVNRHFTVDKLDITVDVPDGKFGFVTFISALEHIPNSWGAMTNVCDLLYYGGYLVVTFPYNEKKYSHNIYTHKDAGYGKDSSFITQVFSRSELNLWMSNTEFEIIEQKYYKVFTGEMWTFGDRTKCKEVTVDETHHLTCILMKKTIV